MLPLWCLRLKCLLVEAIFIHDLKDENSFGIVSLTNDAAVAGPLEDPCAVVMIGFTSGCDISNCSGLCTFTSTFTTGIELAEKINNTQYIKNNNKPH